jgi:hypothetical protein
MSMAMPTIDPKLHGGLITQATNAQATNSSGSLAGNGVSEVGPSQAVHGNATVEGTTARSLWQPWLWISTAGRWFIVRPIELMSLIIVFGVLSAIPIVNLFVLGYFLEATGHLARGGRWRTAMLQLSTIGGIGLAMIAVLIAALPIRLLAYFAETGEIIEAGNWKSKVLRLVALLAIVPIATHLFWAWTRGGRLRNYFWPAPWKFIKEVWRPSTWQRASHQLQETLSSLRVRQRMWLGLKGTIGTLLWLVIPAGLMIALMRNGREEAAGLAVVFVLPMMMFVLARLPLLQAEFSKTGKLRDMFAVRRAWGAFRRSPLACWLAIVTLLTAAVPLYLLKIEATPREAAWLPAIFFVALMLPAHLVGGWAVGRADKLPEPRGVLRFGYRWALRLTLIPLLIAYCFILYLAQVTSWEGLSVWLQQHAFLIPAPPVT